jgi:lipopolysaccharide transport system ATP-binding protein
MQSAVKIEGLSKAYRIGLKEQKHDTLGANLLSMLKQPMESYKRIRNLGRVSADSQDADIFWALDDVSFTVNPGEVLGIIGKNGAGKSTLLKLISRITEPTKGSITLNGRIASLLEVGTGFNPELSGRDNVYLNGTILGMKKKEIDKQFDEIIDFSGIEKFIDTPVKRYSSGMKVRLGFAVAAHLEPEILIIDEVLAVGDVEFQTKCLHKMENVSHSGKTILFVSHNMAAIKSLCKKGLVLSGGKVIYEGDINNSVNHYLDHFKTAVLEGGKIPENLSTYNTGDAKFTHLVLLDDKNNPTNKLKSSERIKIQMEINMSVDVAAAIVDVKIVAKDGIEVVHSMSLYERMKTFSLKKGVQKIQVEFDNHLQPGLYYLTIGVHNSVGTTMDYVEAVNEFEVQLLSDEDDNTYNEALAHGYIKMKGEWKQI